MVLGRKTIAAALALGLAAAIPSAADAGGAVERPDLVHQLPSGALGDIWTMNPDGSGLRRLTTDTAGEPPLYDAQSDWSPDGRWLAFRRGPNASTRLGVWKMTRYGEQQRLLARGIRWCRARTRRSRRGRPTAAACCSARTARRSRTRTSGRWTRKAATSASSLTCQASSCSQLLA